MKFPAAATMCNIIAATLLLAISHALAAADNRHGIGRSFYIPNTDILDDRSGGHEILESIKKECIYEVLDPQNTRNFLYYEDEQSFYNFVGTEASIGGKLTNTFIMGATLGATSNGIRASDTSIKGAALDIASYNREVYVDVGCIYGSKLATKVKARFEHLPKHIENPEDKTSWLEYDTFLKTFGSHLVQKAYFGSRMNQYIFTKQTQEYDSRDYNIKACEKFEGLADIGKLHVRESLNMIKKQLNIWKLMPN